MSQKNWNLERLNHNSQRSYPLAADATKKDITGSFEIPDDFLVDLDIPVAASFSRSTASCFISQVGLFGSGVQITVSVSAGSGFLPIATALVPFNNFVNDSTFVLNGVDLFTDSVGTFTVGRLEAIKKQPAGLFNFNLSGGRIEPQAIRPSLRRISSIRVLSSNGVLSEKLIGDVILVAGRNTQLAVTAGADPVIQVNFIGGAGTIATCECADPVVDLPSIKTINGQPANTSGSFILQGDDCMEFEPISGGIKATNTCATPCCGPTELEELTRELEQLNVARAQLEQYVNSLSAETVTFRTVILGSRLGDKRCLNCT